tara:strand:+ start:333 stop:1112 length:780 start_codon:yes stop_codon:yes gene_type:complete
VLFTSIVFTNVFSQNCDNIKVLGATKLYISEPLPIIDERDVMWHRRLWREIDLTETANQDLYFSKGKDKANCSLYDVFYSNLMNGSLKAYDTFEDDFSKELTVNQIINSVGDSVLDKNGKLIYQNLESISVMKYWLKEDWFFDSKYSKIDVRIVGLCPVKIKLDKNGNVLGYKQLFWLYFPNIRNVLVNTEVPEKENSEDGRVSYEDVFLKRLFSSYIIQKNGGQKQHVSKHKTELDIKLENEKTKQYSFKRETGLWGN